MKNKEDTERYLGIAQEENTKLISLVNEILRSSIGLKENESENIDLHMLLQEVVESKKLLLDTNGGRIDVKLNALYHHIQIDKQQLSSVFHNLLDNAIKYSNEDVVIAIETQNIKEGISISFQDNGIGISKKDQRHVFERFYRVSTGNIQNVKGFGLGLNYVAQVMNLYKGTIEVKSQLNEGSTFTIYFPLTINNINDNE